MRFWKKVIRPAVSIIILAVFIMSEILPVCADEDTAFGLESEPEEEVIMGIDPETGLAAEEKVLYDPDTELAEIILEEQETTDAIFSIISPFTYPYMQLGSSARFRATKKAEWTTSDEKVVKIFSNGKVFAAGRGTATIKAVAKDGSKDTAQYTLTVCSFNDTGKKIIGHRGYSKYAPENTRASFRLAAESGMSVVECDVYKTADDVFVLSHDNTLIRIFGDARYITDHTYNDLKDLVAVYGNGTDVYQDEHIATLDSYMKIIAASDKTAVLDIKQEFDQEYMDKLYSEVSSFGINERVTFLAGAGQMLLLEDSIERYMDLYDTKPNLMLANSTDPSVSQAELGDLNAFEYAAERGYSSVCTRYYYVNAEKVMQAHELGVKVAVWTINDYSVAYYYAYVVEADEIISDLDHTRYIFKDVLPSHNYAKAVYWAASKRITEGYTDGSGLFGVDDKLTRGQAVTFLWRMAGRPEPESNEKTFKDVSVKHSYYKAIQWAYEQGITEGYKDGSFGINKTCTRGHIAMFIWRYYGRRRPKNMTQVFSDVPETHGYFRAVQWVNEQGIAKGYDSGVFGVDGSCTRGHMVTFLYRSAMR